MPIFRQQENSCYFAHIPRTGGRYITELFKQNSAYGPWCEDYNNRNEILRGIHAKHLHYPLYNFFFNVGDLEHFSVVRNPFNKISSSMKVMHEFTKNDYNEILNTEEKFYDFLINEIELESFHNNWFLPQYKFVNKKTHIWKYEDGFGDKFFDWIYQKTNIVLREKQINKYEEVLFSENVVAAEHNIQYNINPEFEKYIKNFYKKDYELFGY